MLVYPKRALISILIQQIGQKNRMIAYGVFGKVSSIDPQKTWDYHTAFDIKPTEVVYNVDLDMSRKKI